MTSELRLPHAELAVVPQEKLLGYLLNDEHPTGGPKARFFRQFGFNPESAKVFEEALKRHAVEGRVALTQLNQWALKYIVEEPLQTPDDRNPLVRSTRQVRV